MVANATPRVSVCVPVHDGERHLATTLRSVLASTLTDLEIVVLDNASTDRSVEIAVSFDDPRLRIEHTEQLRPLTENWNRCVPLARAPLVKVVSHDDVIRPRCLDIQATALIASPGAAFVVHRQDLIDVDGHLLAPDRFRRGLIGEIDRDALVRRVVRHGANPVGAPAGVMFRRDAFDATDGFRADRTFLADLDLWLQLVEHGPMIGGSETLAAFRMAPGSVSASATREQYAQ